MTVKQSGEGTAGTKIRDSCKQDSRYKLKRGHLRGLRNRSCIGVGIDKGASGVLNGGIAVGVIGKMSLFVSTLVPLFLSTLCSTCYAFRFWNG